MTTVQTSNWVLTGAQIRDRTASLSPTPGGGSISIMTATLGLALIHKGASISLKKAKDDSKRTAKFGNLCDLISSALVSLSKLADADSCAYQSYVRARSLPRATETEKFIRKTSMEAALLQATQIPLKSATEMYRALEAAETAIKLADRHLLTDIFAGALLIGASIQGVLLNVDANLSGISDASVQEAMSRERVELERASVVRSEALAHAYQTRVSAVSDR